MPIIYGYNALGTTASVAPYAVKSRSDLLKPTVSKYDIIQGALDATPNVKPMGFSDREIAAAVSIDWGNLIHKRMESAGKDNLDPYNQLKEKFNKRYGSLNLIRGTNIVNDQFVEQLANFATEKLNNLYGDVFASELSWGIGDGVLQTPEEGSSVKTPMFTGAIDFLRYNDKA